MSFVSHKLLACFFALLVLGVGAPVVAQDGEKEAEEKVDPYAELQRANKLASYNALTRAIPHYKKVIEAAPRQYPIAHFNLGEVYRVKGECAPAVLYFRAYVRVGNDKGAVRDAKKAIAECTKDKELAKLTIEAKPEETTQIKINSAIFTETGKVDALELLPGEYEIAAEAVDHLPQTKTVKLEEGGEQTVEVELVHKTYFGELAIEVDQKDATISVKPLELDAPRSDDFDGELTFEVSSPMDEARKLPTGKYSVEVNKKDYDRWIRYVRVERDDTTRVNVEMTRALPSEIR